MSKYLFSLLLFIFSLTRINFQNTVLSQNQLNLTFSNDTNIKVIFFDENGDTLTNGISISDSMLLQVGMLLDSLNKYDFDTGKCKVIRLDH